MKERDPGRIKRALMEKGVNIPNPESVEIGPEVDPARISADGVLIHSGCRLFGSETLLLPGVELGAEGPVTVRNCFVGRDVRLRGGSYEGSCFLDGVRMGPGAQIRTGCLLEEGARGAHTVGLKQTILFPFVTLGSLINFCDCLMAGGTDAGNHSEVGSSYIHFNYTPNQDKATASLIGDVPRGVMLNRAPIFLGGQGGLIGPLRIGYGITVAAGTIVRKDLLKENLIVLGRATPARDIPLHHGLYTNVQHLVTLNTLYISNLIALRRWYLDVRSRFTGDGEGEKELFKGAVKVLMTMIRERLKRFGEVAAAMPRSIDVYRAVRKRTEDPVTQRKKELFDQWPHMEGRFLEGLEEGGDPALREGFIAAVNRGFAAKGQRYLEVIKGLDEKEAALGTAWVQSVVDCIQDGVREALPSFRGGENRR